MCRDIANGGRRCPSHTNPTLIANRNAKRRALYAKGKTGGSTSQESGTLNALGLVVTPVTGELVERKYFNDKEFSGIIDYTKLDDDSYKEFGFKDPMELRDTMEHHDDLDFLIEVSNEEMKDLNNQQREALMLFTTNEYSWINSTFYNDKPTNSGITKGSIEDIESRKTKIFAEDEDDNPGYYDFSHENQTPALIEELSGHMDSALDTGPYKQRIVYRGMRETNSAFNGTSIEEYVSKNLQVGQEMVFDGYQSTSMSATLALAYSDTLTADENGKPGLFFEILTPTGVNVVGVSNYEDELEVILPRGARYMVVGVHENSSIATTRHQQDCTVVQVVAITDDGAICTSDNRHVAPKVTDKQLYGVTNS